MDRNHWYEAGLGHIWLPYAQMKTMRPPLAVARTDGCRIVLADGRDVFVDKLDLGAIWSATTGLPFVYAFWAGRNGRVTPQHVARLQDARDVGLARSGEIATDYYRDAPQWQALGARYLRDNIKYSLGDSEREGLELFYRWAWEAGAVDRADPVRFF